MARSANDSTALQTLHYIAPACVLVYFCAARAIATCCGYLVNSRFLKIIVDGRLVLHKPSKSAGGATRRYTAIALLAGICATLVGQAITYLARSLAEPGTWAPQDAVVYLMVSVFAYGSLVIGVAETSSPLWHPYLGACLLGAAFETPIAVLDLLLHNTKNDFVFSRLALQLCRTALLVAFCLIGSWHARQDRLTQCDQGDEAAPLLSNGAPNGAPTAAKSYGAFPGTDEEYDDGSSDIGSDAGDPDETKDLKKKQLKRVEEKGSWIGYVKEFKIFIPMLWPTKNRFVQGCLAVIGLVLFAERFLNVLVPRQLGIITEKLTENTGVFPVREVAIWGILSYLSSRAGLSVVQNLAELPVQQFAYKSIGAESFAHIMGLSMDFHNDKSSGELIRAVDQGQNLQGLLEFALFQVAPMFIDLGIAFVYVYILFDIYMSCILAFVGVAYIWVGAKTTAWSVRRRRRFNTA